MLLERIFEFTLFAWNTSGIYSPALVVVLWMSLSNGIRWTSVVLSAGEGVTLLVGVTTVE